MKLINHSKYRAIEVDFRLQIDSRLLEIGEDFCMDLTIETVVDSVTQIHESIRIDRTSIEQFIEHINKYINREIDMIDYMPLEESFWLFEKKHRLSEQETHRIIDFMKEWRYDQETIQELENHPLTTTLVLFIDALYSKKHGNSTCTGNALIINVTRQNLISFVEEFKLRYKSLIDVS